MSRVDCETKTCHLTFRIVENCLVYVASNLTDCEVPCKLEGCGIIHQHNTRCPIWICEDHTTTASTSTSSASTSTEAPAPMPQSSLKVFLYCLLAFAFVIMVITATLKRTFFKTLYLRIIHRRDSRRGRHCSFFGCCTDSETELLLDPIIRAEARETVNRILQMSNLASGDSSYSILNENLEDSIEYAVDQEAAAQASRPALLHMEDANGPDPEVAIQPGPNPITATASAATAAAKTALKKAKKKVKQKVGAAVEQISSKYRNPFTELHEN